MSDVYDFLGYNWNKTPPFAQGFRLCTAALLRAGADPELRNEGNGAALSGWCLGPILRRWMDQLGGWRSEKVSVGDWDDIPN
jgi:hypothetical protein